MARRKRQPRCIVIAGPNGAGKTTFARRYLPNNARIIHFVNADLIAAGLSPLKPELASIAAARTVPGGCPTSSIRIASRNFVTECLINDVTGGGQAWCVGQYFIDLEPSTV